MVKVLAWIWLSKVNGPTLPKERCIEVDKAPEVYPTLRDTEVAEDFRKLLGNLNLRYTQHSISTSFTICAGWVMVMLYTFIC